MSERVVPVTLEDLLGENDVIFTQFLRPTREPRSVWIEVPPEVAGLARTLRLAGYRFECEELTTGDVHADVSNDDTVLALFVCPNGPAVPGNIEGLIRRAHVTWLARGGGFPHGG